MDDEFVAAAIARGDHRSALEALMQLYGDDLHRFCLSMLGDRTAAEDVVQTVFVQLHRDLASFIAGTSPRPWLYAIARNRCIDLARHRGRARRLFHRGDDHYPDPPDTAPSAEERLVAEGWTVLLNECLYTLKEDDRSLVLLRFQEQLSYDEIAETMGVTTGALRVRIARIMPRLRRCMESKGVQW